MNFAIQSTLEKSNPINWTTGFSVITFVMLFHKSDVGLNLAIFDIFILLFWLSSYPKRFAEPKVFLTATALFATAICTAWYGTPETVLWSFICLALLSQWMLYPENSILFSETKAFLNIFLGPLHALSNALKAESGNNRRQRIIRLLLVVLLPLCFAFLFASMYQNFNPYFEKTFNDLLSLLDLSILITIFFAVWASLFIFKNHIPEKLTFIDQMLGDNFSEEAAESYPHAALEKQVGLALFGTLNLVLLIFLVSDIAFVNRLGQGFGEDYSRYVHEGVGILIFSIVLATAFILYFFRGRDFSRLANNEWLKSLALLWVVLNIGILITTALKNGYYVGTYGLTLMRVGVFVYLTLAATGLILAFIKVFLGRTNAFLFRKLYWSFFIILTANICMDWSAITTRYNIRQHIQYGQPLDWQYLFSLNERTLPIIAENKKHMNLPEEEMTELNKRLDNEANHLRSYNPEWREMSLARVNAKTKLAQL